LNYPSYNVHDLGNTAHRATVVDDDNDCFEQTGETSACTTCHGVLIGTIETSSLPDRVPIRDDIKVEFHRSANLPTAVYAFEEFKRDRGAVNPDLLKDRPWHPFNSRLEFEFAELTHDAHMNKGQIARLLDIVHRARSRQDTFEFQHYDDVDLAWEKAKLFHPSVSHVSTLSVT
jgi:hypothetical protein